MDADRAGLRRWQHDYRPGKSRPPHPLTATFGVLRGGSLDTERRSQHQSSTWPVEPGGDEPVRDRCGRRKQRPASAQIVTGEPPHVFELVVAGAELTAYRARLEPEHQR